jgi:hypothetical protein
MAITATDIKFYLSGGAANSDVNASLGGAISSTEITSASLHNLFDQVSSAEASSGEDEYRGFYVKNTHGTLTWQSVKAWLTDTGGAQVTLYLALCDEGVNATMETVANENTAPSGPTFSQPTSEGAGLSLGNIAAGQHYGIWVRRNVPASASAANADTAVIRFKGDTAA